MSDIRKFFSGNMAVTKHAKKPSKRKIIIDSDDEDATASASPSYSTNQMPQVEPDDYFAGKKPVNTEIFHVVPEVNRHKRVKSGNVYASGDNDVVEIIQRRSPDLQSDSRLITSANVIPIKSSPSESESAERDSKSRKSGRQGNRGKTANHPEETRHLEISSYRKLDQIPPRSTSRHKDFGSPRKSAAKESLVIEAKQPSVASIIDAIPSVELPEETVDVKFKYGQPTASAIAPGSKEIPDGSEDCLAGLTFVFTGILQSLERTEAIDLVKRYGGKVTTAPSRNTDFVVLGDQAGPSKIKKIKTLGVKSIDEDGLLQLIATMPGQGGDTKAAQKAMDKRHSEQIKAQQSALEMEKTEEKARVLTEQKTYTDATSGVVLQKSIAKEQLWTSKYAPSSMKDVVGNKSNVEKLSRFLTEWPKSLKANFKKAGPDGLGLYRAVLLSGSPGIGKTTSAHLAAKLAGFDIIEFNASDTRSKRLLEEGLKDVVHNNSLTGYIEIDGQVVDKKKRQLVLIMDEVDGMSSGDRGGVGALNAVIRKSTIPVICICNDRSSQKLKPLEKTTFDLKFSKPTKDQIRSRIMSIAYKEKLQIQATAIDQLVESTGSDIRQIINLLSTYRLTMDSMTLEEGRAGAKNAEKHVVLKPWDIVSQLLNGANYSDRTSSSLNEKIELYFNDHELSYLMVQENYLNTNPIRARTSGNPKEQQITRLRLLSKAALAISDGDLVDAMIHGPQQHWSLMPTHAVFSCVRPASFVAGPGSARTAFTMVLGNLSKLNKSNRLLKEIRSHLRLKTSGDRHEIRVDYIPVLFNQLPKVLMMIGPEAIPQIIDIMDAYYLSKEDYDNLLELGIGDNKRENIDSGILSSTKSSFTRQYNKSSHPSAFLAQTATGPAVKKLPNLGTPDFEEAVDLSDDELEVKDDKEDDESKLDLKTDRMISAPKMRAAGSKKKRTNAASKK